MQIHNDHVQTIHDGTAQKDALMNATNVAEARIEAWPDEPTWIKQWWLLLVVFGFFYAPTIAGMVGDWWNNPDYSHGFLIPFAIAYLLWQKRDIYRRLPAISSWWGLVIVVSSQVIFLLGFLGSEFFLQRFSMVLLVAGALVFAAGWQFLKESVFPLLLLVLTIPLPAIVFNELALPLQLVASSWAERFLRVCTVPVYREGNVLQLATQMLNVTEACSGIRSLVSLITLALMVAYFTPLRWWMRTVFVLSAVPIALVANAFRVAGTGLLGQWFGPRAASGFFHLFSGWVVFLLAFGVLLGESALMQHWAKPRGRIIP